MKFILIVIIVSVVLYIRGGRAFAEASEAVLEAEELQRTSSASDDEYKSARGSEASQGSSRLDYGGAEQPAARVEVGASQVHDQTAVAPPVDPEVAEHQPVMAVDASIQQVQRTQTRTRRTVAQGLGQLLYDISNIHEPQVAIPMVPEAEPLSTLRQAIYANVETVDPAAAAAAAAEVAGLPRAREVEQEEGRRYRLDLNAAANRAQTEDVILAENLDDAGRAPYSRVPGESRVPIWEHGEAEQMVRV